MKRDLIVAILLTFCLTASIFMVATTKSAEYDPWVDLNGNGKIDIYDVVGMTSIYGTTGDSTRNISVVNWPAKNQETVWYGASATGGSIYYNASGFGHLHITWYVNGLSGLEHVTIYISTPIDHPEGGGTFFVNYLHQFDVYSTNSTGELSIPVPAQRFAFNLVFASGTTAYVYFAYYLTYA